MENLINIVFCWVLGFGNLFSGPDKDFKTKRESMVKTQIENRGIKDKKVLGAMLKVERHEFVPLELRNYAYKDRPLPIGKGQTISQPYIVALMTELLELKGGEKVLEVGTGSGYQAAVLARLAKKIYTIEIIPELAAGAEKLLKNLGYENVEIKAGDGWLGWKEHAPFDAIIVTCAPGEMPLRLIEQLADDGRMVLPLGTGYQELKLIRKTKGVIKIENIAPVRFVPMIKKKEN
ncbi:MAG: protein-L-isoaspartate(D-aspartate) O-methyltransferase [Elusimicrobiales bacterium]|nr:protein-L-isoaspartate(D-aspartate) O-methyltransferase [Elusimicrobiales bacterium]